MRLARRQPVERARRLLRWYPQSWRIRYGEEFAEFLEADIVERPRCWSRSWDVVRAAAVARFTCAGLSGHELSPDEQWRAGLATLGVALVAFLAFGVTMWSQLTVGWHWSRPNSPVTAVATVVMSIAMYVTVALAAIAGLAVAWHAFTEAKRRRSLDIARPILLVSVGAAVLVAGSIHFAKRWPGTGGHHWLLQGLVPAGVSALAWASTMSVSAFWMHPGSLAGFPSSEVAWMVVSPLAMAFVAIGATKVVRRMDLTAPLIRVEARVAQVLCGTMTVFLAAAGAWVLDGGPGPANLYRSGSIDAVALAAVCAASFAAHRAISRARRGQRPCVGA